MIELLFIVGGVIFVWLIARNNRSKKVVYDSRSTVGYGPDNWLNDKSFLSCPDCGYKAEARTYFRNNILGYNFICPKCKNNFEIK